MSASEVNAYSGSLISFRHMLASPREITACQDSPALSGRDLLESVCNIIF